MVDPSDVLRAPLFTVRPGPAPCHLGDLLARLLLGPDIADFPRLAPEQRAYWWRFLVRCAAKALHELHWAMDELDGRPAGELAAALTATLATQAPPAGWLLHQPDPAQPGFLQIPTPDDLDPAHPDSAYTPRSISLLTGALGQKNHERKADAVRALDAEQTVYALVEYQTAAIYGGAGNYGSQLQGSASGAGSGTPFMGARVAQSLQATFRHDVRTLLDSWSAIVDTGLAGSVWALWCRPWQGEKDGGLPSTELDPAFIPVARMVRLAAPTAGRYGTVHFRPTQGRRVEDHTAGGCLGDPFCPLVSEPKLKVRGTLEKGYDYQEVVQLLFGGDKHAGPSPSVRGLLGAPESGQASPAVRFEGVAYEQGKTVGVYRREVLLPASGGIAWLAKPEPVRAVHRTLLEKVKETKTALRGAARIVLSGKPTPRPSDAKKVDRVAEGLEQRVDAVYLDYLFAAAAQYEIDGAEQRWDLPLVDWLAAQAREVLRDGFAALPCSTNQRLQREIRAADYLDRRLRDLRGEVDHEEVRS